MDNIIIPISQIKNLKWGTGVTQLVSGLAGLQTPEPELFTSTYPPASECRNSSEDFKGEVRKLLVGAAYVLSSWNRKMVVKSLE